MQSRLSKYKLLAAEMVYQKAYNIYESAISKIDFQKRTMLLNIKYSSSIKIQMNLKLIVFKKEFRE